MGHLTGKTSRKELLDEMGTPNGGTRAGGAGGLPGIYSIERWRCGEEERFHPICVVVWIMIPLFFVRPILSAVMLHRFTKRL